VILVCAATGAEARACQRGIAAAGAHGLEVLRTGVGPRHASRTLIRRLETGPRPRLVVSSGFAGTMTEGLNPLTWVTALSLYHLVGDRAVPAGVPPEMLCLVPGAQVCALVSADHVGGAGAPVGAPASPLAVDMESASLAEAASAAGIPLAVLRLVTDTPNAPLPSIAWAVAATLASRAPLDRARQAARVFTEALADPIGALEFARRSLRWCERLQDGWKGFAVTPWIRR